MADRNGYIGRAPGDSSVIVARKVYEPTGVQTDFTFNSGYTPGYCDVYLNGVRLIDEKDFTASNGSTVGLTSAAQSGDVVELVVYKAYNLGVPLADVTGNLDVTGNISASSSITADGAFYGDGSNLSNIAGTGITQYIAANSLTVIGSPGVSTITRLGVTDAVVTGIITANGLSGNVTGAALTITGNATFNSNVTIGGTLTYEDVTNIDSLGIVTARAGVNVSGGQIQVGAAFSVGNAGVATAAGFVGPLTGNVTGNASGTAGGLTGTPNISCGTIAGSTGTFTGDVDIADKIVHTGDTNTALRFPSADTITAETGGSERVRIDSNGKILAGTTSSRNVAGGAAKLQIEATSSEGMSLIRTSDDNGSVYLSLGKTRDGSVCQVADKLGTISWNGDDGTDLAHASAEIYTEVATGIGGNDVPGDLIFSTNGGTTTTTERLRILSDGQIGVGVAAPTFAAINSVSANAARGIEIFKDGTDTGSALKLAGDNGSGTKSFSQLGYSGANNTAHWANYNTSGTELGRIVIGSTGNVGIKSSAPAALLDVRGDSIFNDRVYWKSSGTTKMSTLASNAGMNWQDSVKAEFGNSGDLKIYHESNVNYIYGGSTNFPTVFMTNATERVRIKGDGETNIGTGSTTIAKFCLTGASNGGHQIVGQASNNVAALDVYSQHGSDANKLSFAVSDNRTGSKSNAFVVKGNGKVGIGTDNPDELLSLHGTANNVRIRIDSQNIKRNNYIGVSAADNLEIAADEDNAGSASGIRFRVDAAERARFNGSGNLGIGTVTPARRLHLHEESSDTVQLHITNSTTGVSGSDGVSFALGSDESLIINQRESNHISLKTADTERLRVASGGAVLIGGLTTQVSDTSLLAVGGGDTNIGVIQVHAGGGESDGDLAGITFSHGSGTTDTARAKAAIASRATGSYGRGDLCFYVDGTGDNNPVAAADEKLRIGTSGQLGIGGANYGTSGQVLTSGGSGAAPSWADAGGGATEVIQSWDFGANYGQSYFETSATGITTSSGFIAYELIISGLQFVGGESEKLSMRVYKSGGSLESGDSYKFYCRKSQFTSTSDENETDNSEDKWTFMGTGNNDREFWDGSIKWKNPGYTTGKTMPPFMRAEWYQQYRFAHFDVCQVFGFANTDYISGFRIYNSSDASVNLMSGRACLIGYKFA